MKGLLHAQYKNLHDSIKPIRGRAVEARPIGERRRDWELIEMDGDVVACRLYNTQVVRYYPDGRIGVQCGGWQTPSTADFIYTHSPWPCIKRNNKLWLVVREVAENQISDKYMHYPLPKEGEVIFEPTENERWKPVSEIVVQKRVVNRDKAKEARAPYQPFLKWAETFMKLSDGWIMHETRKEAIPMTEDGYFSYRDFAEPVILNMAKSGDDAEYLKALCAVLCDGSNAIGTRIADRRVQSVGGHSYSTTYYDMQFSYDLLKTRIYRMVEKVSHIYDKVDVDVTTRVQWGIF
jgi:hypothetical protein